jgi:HEPN domain-containing protein
MSHELADPTDPREWLRRARSDIALARAGRITPDVLYQDLCFHAQQAAEKALKAVRVQLQREFPKTHSIVELLRLVGERGVILPEPVREAAVLTRYAVQDRYPGLAEDATPEDHQRAISPAERVLQWAESVVTANGER